MRALFLTTHTPNNEVFWKSLECVGADVIVQRHDDRPYERHHELLGIARGVAPDVIVKVGALDFGAGISNPVPRTDILRQLRGVAPSILLCGDAADALWWPVLDEYRAKGCFDLVVSMDGRERDGLLAKLTPVDVRPYVPQPWAERRILVGCNGGPGGERGEAITVLGAATPGGVVSSDAMAQFLCGCKVVVNGPRNGTGNDDHVKGRVVEAGFAGALLLERKNHATARWFVPGEDYVEYRNPADALEKVRWIRDHDEEARGIAQRLHEKVLMEHHPRVFWRDVLGKVGVKL